MANNILRPRGVGSYDSTAVWHIFNTAPTPPEFWQCLNESDQDGDLNYVYATEAGVFTISMARDPYLYASSSFVRPARVTGVTVVATVRTINPNNTRFKIRLRHHGIDYDSDTFTINSTSYVEVFNTFQQVPNGDAWNSTRLNGIELGLVYVDGVELRCTKLEMQVHTELYPHFVLTPDNNGALHQDWRAYPGTSDAFRHLLGFDGNTSYIYSNTIWNALRTYTLYNLRGIWGTDVDNIYAVGDGGTVLHWDGSIWVKINVGTVSNLYGVFGFNAGDIYVVGDDGVAIHWDGVDWIIMTSGTTQSLRSVWGSATNDVYAVGVFGTVIHWDGITWSTIPVFTPRNLNGLWGFAANDVYAVGNSGSVWHWDGLVWAVVPVGVLVDLNGVFGTAPNNIYAVGDGGTVLHWNGVVWALEAVGIPTNLFCVYGNAANNIIVAGLAGRMSHWNGAVWELFEPDTTEDILAIWCDVATIETYIVGLGGMAMQFDENVWWPDSTFSIEDLPPALPPGYIIDRIKVVGLLENRDNAHGHVNMLVSTAGGDYVAARGTEGQELLPVSWWQTIEEEYETDPDTGWPSGNPGALPWSIATINNLEIGPRNKIGNMRCTSAAIEVFLKNTPVSTLVPGLLANGYHQDVPPRFPNVGEAAVDDVKDDPPDWGATYIGADATAAGTSRYATFTVNPIGPVPPGEQIFCTRVNCWIQLGGATTYATVAVLLRNSNETYLSKPVWINNTGATWFCVRRDFFTSPFTGSKWTLAELLATEYGIVILDGDVNVTSIKVEFETAPEIATGFGLPDITRLRITTFADSLMARSLLDGTIYAVTEFAIGTGGFNPAVPSTVLPVNPADIMLASEIYRDRISGITYDADTLPWTVQYLCRVPREVAVDAIGELGLFATILWSPFPAEIGQKFMFALCHFPCQCRHNEDVQLYRLTIQYF